MQLSRALQTNGSVLCMASVESAVRPCGTAVREDKIVLHLQVSALADDPAAPIVWADHDELRTPKR